MKIFENLKKILWRHQLFSENLKKTYMGWKKNSKNRQKFFFLRNGQNYLKVTKKAQKSKFGSILLDLQPFFRQILRCPKSRIWRGTAKLRFSRLWASQKGPFGGHSKLKNVKSRQTP